MAIGDKNRVLNDWQTEEDAERLYQEALKNIDYGWNTSVRAQTTAYIYKQGRIDERAQK